MFSGGVKTDLYFSPIEVVILLYRYAQLNIDKIWVQGNRDYCKIKKKYFTVKVNKLDQLQKHVETADLRYRPIVNISRKLMIFLSYLVHNLTNKRQLTYSFAEVIMWSENLIKMILRGSSDALEMRRSEAGLERPLMTRVVMCTEMFA